MHPKASVGGLEWLTQRESMSLLLFVVEWMPSGRNSTFQKQLSWGEVRSFVLSTGLYCGSQGIKVTENPV